MDNRQLNTEFKRLRKDHDQLQRYVHDLIVIPRQITTGSEDYKRSSDSGKQETAQSPNPAVSQAKPSVPHQDGTSNKKTDRFPKLTEWKPVIELSGLILILVYTTVTAWQLNTSINANKLTQNGMFLINSPRIYWTKAQIRSLAVGQPIIIDSEFKNLGQLAAERFGVMPLIEIRDSEPPNLEANGGGQYFTELNPAVPVAYAIQSTFALTQAQYESVIDGSMKIYFRGSLRYQNPILPENIDAAVNRPAGGPGAIDVKMFCFFYDLKIGQSPITCSHWTSDYRIVPQYKAKQ